MSFFQGDGRKVRFCDILFPAAEKINRITGMEVLKDQGILTVFFHVGMDLVNGNDVCQGETFQFYIPVKDFEHVCVRSFEPPGDGSGRVIQIPECKHDQHV